MEKLVSIEKNKFPGVPIKNLFDRLDDVRNENGALYSWEATSEGITSPVRFDESYKARECWGITSVIRYYMNDEKGGIDPITYFIGSEKDYGKAIAELSAKKRQEEKKAYIKNIDSKIKLMFRNIKALIALENVCRTFDGKIINCRFNTAVKQATGYYLNLGSYSLELHYYDCKNRKNESSIYINAAYVGTQKVAKEDEWQWQTGDRLEGEKAFFVIESKIKYYFSCIDELQTTKKQYTEYLRKTRRVEKLIEELNGYSYYIQSWAKEHDLKSYVSAGNIWRG